MSRLAKDVSGAQVLHNPSSIEGSESSVESTSSVSASQSEKMSNELVLPEVSNDEVIISGIRNSIDEIQNLQ